jgi:pimeloyl-ACP methyl ester carboxylesterase
MAPQIKYALSGDVSVAYQVTGGGPIDLVFAPGFISHLEHEWDEPRWARFIHELGSIARVIRFDKRGTGLSDRTVVLPNMDERMEDIRAVMDAAGSDQAVLLGISEGGAMCELFAATHPKRVSKLILMGTFSCTRDAVPAFADIDEVSDLIRQNWGTGAMLAQYAPTLSKDANFHEWWAKFERLGASPSAVIGLRKNTIDIDVTHVLPTIQAPTLIIHHTGDIRIRVEAARAMADAIPNAQLVEFPGEDHFVWLDETGSVINEIKSFIGSDHAATETNRVLATLLFTDLVGSTEAAAKMGDASWRAILDTHYSLARNELKRFRGCEVKTLGDGILATFDGPGRAERCAQAIALSMRPLGGTVRAGLHTGEVADDGDVRGIAVHIAARVSQQADSNEVLVSRTVRDLVAGSGISFCDLGCQALKGLDEPLRLYRVVD